MNDYYMTYINPFLEGEKRFLAKIPSNSHLFHKLSESLNLIIHEFSTKERAYEIFIKTEIERIFATMIRYCDYFDSDNKDKFSLASKRIMDDMWEYVQKKLST